MSCKKKLLSKRLIQVGLIKGNTEAPVFIYRFTFLKEGCCFPPKEKVDS